MEQLVLITMVAVAMSVCVLLALNGATCFDHNGGSGYVCLCFAGFAGTNCENGTFNIHCY